MFINIDKLFKYKNIETQKSNENDELNHDELI